MNVRVYSCRARTIHEKLVGRHGAGTAAWQTSVGQYAEKDSRLADGCVVPSMCLVSLETSALLGFSCSESHNLPALLHELSNLSSELFSQHQFSFEYHGELLYAYPVTKPHLQG